MTRYKQLLTFGLLALASGGAIAQTPPNSLIVSETGMVGLGTATPLRQLHLSGANAVFRMDRPVDTAAFMLVRTDAADTPLKTFVVGVNAAGSNDGSFVINDLGTAVAGPGTTRLTITNDGVVMGNLVNTSSRRFKRDIEPLADALERVERLHGVRFVWKDSGRPALGLIAEEVAPVLPEVVEHDADGQAAGINYSALVAVLVEAVKEQQAEFAAYQTRTASLEAQVAGQQAKVAYLESRLADVATMQARLAEIESQLAEHRVPVVLTQR